MCFVSSDKHILVIYEYNVYSSRQVELPALDIESLRAALDAVSMGRGAVKSGTGVAGSGMGHHKSFVSLHHIEHAL